MVNPVLAQGDIETLGYLPEGNFTDVYGISADGSVVVGTSGYYEGVGWDGITLDQKAYQWTSSGGIESLGTLGGGESWASAVSGDGTVIVGGSEIAPGSSSYHAFRWTSSGMQDLGTLPGGFDSTARGVSYDGSVVAGTAWNSSEYDRAFRWTQSTGMEDLGTFGGNTSYANAISGNGLVIVGDADTSTGEYVAFRWTSSGMGNLGTLSGGSNSSAYGVNADGSVVVGWSTGTGFYQHAFRWTQSAGMVDLGTLNGDYLSYANAVSGDGTVIVGESFSTPDEDYFSRRGFRWTQETGMQTVEDWLEDNGVTVPSGLSPVSSVRAVSYDGSVVAGDLVDENGFIARVTESTPEEPEPGLLELNGELAASLASPISITRTNLTLGDLIINGAHSDPLSYRVEEGKPALWVAGDWGLDDWSDKDGGMGLAEVGGGYNFGPLQVNGAFGYTWSNEDLVQKGLLDADGFYLLAETLVPIESRFSAVLSGYYHWGDADIRRGYLNAGEGDFSKGSTDTDTWSLRGRLEFEAIKNDEGDLFSPYWEFTYTSSRMDPYTENGGSFPAMFGERKDIAKKFSIGFDAEKAISDEVKLIGLVEGSQRFENASEGIHGELTDLFSFNLDGVEYDRSWVRAGAGIGIEHSGGMLKIMLNGTSIGEAPSFWIALRYQKAF